MAQSQEDPSIGPFVAFEPKPFTPRTSRFFDERLGMPFDQRLLLSAFSAFTCGTFLGYTTTSRLASLRFRAENAHRLPVSQPGWYLYHKSKSYYKTRHGVVAGVRSGFYLAAWSSIFFVIEESMDVFRGTWRAGRTLDEMEGVDELNAERMERGVGKCRDFWSSTVAGMVTGGLWSAWNGFPMVTAARTIRMGILAGLGFGVTQDMLSWARGRNPDAEGRIGRWMDRVVGKPKIAEDEAKS